MAYAPWLLHVAVAAFLFLVGWGAVGRPSPQERFRAAGVHLVNFGFFLVLGLLFYAFSLDLAGYDLEEPVVWSIYGLLGLTLTACLLFGPGFQDDRRQRSLLRGFWLVLLGASVAVKALYPPGIVAFIGRIDVFLASRLHFDALSLPPVTPAVIGAAVFAYTYGLFSYYGMIGRIVLQERVEQEKGGQDLIDTEVVDKSFSLAAGGLALVITLLVARVDIGSVTIFSGVILAAITFSLRDLLSNLVAGLLLMWDKSIGKGAVISLDEDTYGMVQQVGMRYTLLVDRNNVSHIIPSSILISSRVTNWSKVGNIRLKLDIGVSYASNIRRAKELMERAALANKRVLRDPPPRVLIIAFEDSSITLQLRFFIDDPQNGIRNVKSEIYESIFVAFNDQKPKIEIPFPQHVVQLVRDPGTAEGNGGEDGPR